jgi:hypothetical protein
VPKHLWRKDGEHLFLSLAQLVIVAIAVRSYLSTDNAPERGTQCGKIRSNVMARTIALYHNKSSDWDNVHSKCIGRAKCAGSAATHFPFVLSLYPSCFPSPTLQLILNTYKGRCKFILVYQCFVSWWCFVKSSTECYHHLGHYLDCVWSLIHPHACY